MRFRSKPCQLETIVLLSPEGWRPQLSAPAPACTAPLGGSLSHLSITLDGSGVDNQQLTTGTCRPSYIREQSTPPPSTPSSTVLSFHGRRCRTGSWSLGIVIENLHLLRQGGVGPRGAVHPGQRRSSGARGGCCGATGGAHSAAVGAGLHASAHVGGPRGLQCCSGLRRRAEPPWSASYMVAASPLHHQQLRADALRSSLPS